MKKKRMVGTLYLVACSFICDHIVLYRFYLVFILGRWSLFKLCVNGTSITSFVPTFFQDEFNIFIGFKLTAIIA